MYGAAYHRAEAELCLEIARLMSDVATAERLEAQAERHLQAAAAIEQSVAATANAA